MSNQPPKSTAVPATPGSKGSHAAGTHPAHHDEDALHVPKGVSRGTFIFLVALIIFLMIIWLVPNAMFGIATGDKNPVRARFTPPGGSEVEWKSSDLLVAHRAISDAFSVDFLLPIVLQVDGNKPENTELTRLMVLDRIAQGSGIEISDKDLAGHIDQMLSFRRWTRQDFLDGVRARGLEQVAVERTIRMLLRVSRFEQLLGYVGAVPDPAKIEEQWNTENVEFAFQYVSLPVADVKAAASQELPGDTELEAWFGKLPDGDKAAFKTQEKRTAEVAFFRDIETTPAAELVAAFPEVVLEGGEPSSAEELANQYYNRVQWRRFAKPKEADAPEGSIPGFFSFDEVQDACLAEAPVFFAMQRWIEDLNARHTNGETLDFGAEAQTYGLDLQTYLEPLTRADLTSEAGANDRDIANAVFSAPPDGSVFASPLAISQGIAVVRANSRSEPEMPAFGEIRDQVAEKWIEPKAEELAKKRLADLREAFEGFEPAPKEGETPPPRSKKEKKPHRRATDEAFQAAAQAQGLDIKFRDYLNKAGPPSKDALSDDEERRTLFSQANVWGLYNLETDELAEPALSADQKTAFLVRLAGKRTVPIDQMSPTQYDGYKQNARQAAMSSIGKKLDLDYLRQNFGLWLYEDSPEAKEAEAKAAKS